MVISINSNVGALSAQANINTANNATNEAVAQLSSGNRIIHASDDVTALAIGTSLGTQISILNTAQTNATQGTSLLQVADGALAQIQAILQQQQSIANQAESGTLTNTDRGFLNQQFQALTSEIDSIASGTTFNGVNLIDGSIATGGSNNPLRDATVGAAVSGAVVGFTASTNVSAIATQLTNDGATKNDTTFIGALSGGVFQGTGAANSAQVITYTINGSTYIGTLAQAGTSLALDNGNATITFTVATNTTGAESGSALAAELQTDVATATNYAIHTVATVLATDSNGNNIAGSAITAAATGGTLLDGFTGANVKISGNQFNTTSLPSISNFAATGTGTTTQFSVVVNGVTYSTNGSAVTDGGSTDEIAQAQWGSDTAGHMILYANGNTTSKDSINLTFTGVIGASAKYATTAEVADFVSALNGAFGSGGNQGGLTFQLGASSSSNVTVNIANSKSSSLFAGATLDVSTAGDASTAATAVQTALNTITATRASVGALESEFNFAASNIQSSVQNETAAQSGLLDTDIAGTSTQYATDQVKLQAGISVLAQANQQQQALLKLIG